LLSTDCHSHVLPGVDDGARTAQESTAMLQKLVSQGVRRVVATPHFRGHRDNVWDFCQRRNQALGEIYRYAGQEAIDLIYLGAEVALEYGVAETPYLDRLCYECGNYILLEFPYRPFSQWMCEEIINIACEYDLIPVIAHIDRYHEVFTKSDYDQIFSMRGVIFQINNEAFASRGGRRVVDRLIKLELPFVLGSDSHNMGSRSPNFDLPEKHLRRYQPHPEALRFLRTFR